MDNREKDIQKLCQAVIDNSLRWETDENGPDGYWCVFCDAFLNNDSLGESTKLIKHKITCPVLIARDLLTKR